MPKPPPKTIRVAVFIVGLPTVSQVAGGWRMGDQIVDLRPVDGEDMRFEALVAVGGRPDGSKLNGPYVHGSTHDRHLKIAWVGADRHVQRAIKVPLKTLTSELIDEARASGRILAATITGKAKDGGLACATIPLLNSKLTPGRKSKFQNPK